MFVGSAPSTTRSKYLLDPSVQSGSTGYGQSSNVYTPQVQQYNNNQFNGNAAPAFGQPQAAFQPMVPAPISTQPLNQFVPFTPNAAPGREYLSGVPPIEMGQEAAANFPPPPQHIKNPTPPPGWNDPPALKTSRKPVSVVFFFFCFSFNSI